MNTDKFPYELTVLFPTGIQDITSDNFGRLIQIVRRPIRSVSRVNVDGRDRLTCLFVFDVEKDRDLAHDAILASLPDFTLERGVTSQVTIP